MLSPLPSVGKPPLEERGFRESSKSFPLSLLPQSGNCPLFTMYSLPILFSRRDLVLFLSLMRVALFLRGLQGGTPFSYSSPQQSTQYFRVADSCRIYAPSLSPPRTKVPPFFFLLRARERWACLLGFLDKRSLQIFSPFFPFFSQVARKYSIRRPYQFFSSSIFFPFFCV